MSIYRTIDDVSDALMRAKAEGGKGCSLLIGAGCSAKAGIPLASQFVEHIRKEYPLHFERAHDKSYAKCMAQLPPYERRELIRRYVDGAKINWAHLCIALLVQQGYIERVLTTNFDPLVGRACAMIGEFPAIYDFASSQLLKTSYIPKKAVFYLHGQHTGFVLMNTDEDLKKHSELLTPVFSEATPGRVWLVVGYSGENDPVFDHLAQVQEFDKALYWIGYRDSEPAKHVRERLLSPEKYAFFVRGFDADDFFVTLTQKLSIFPPELVERPFTHLHRSLKSLAPYSHPGYSSEEDVTVTSLRLIGAAIEQYETLASELTNRDQTSRLPPLGDVGRLEMLAQTLLLKGEYHKVLELHRGYEHPPSTELANTVAWAYVMNGNALLDQAKMGRGEARRLMVEAQEQYRAALDVKPNRHDVLISWGNALLDEAKATTGPEAEKLFAAAEEKYDAALRLDPGAHEALVNWGNALLDRAKTRTGDAADQLFAAAEEKYDAALRLDPGAHGALVNWGNALLDHAKTRTGDAATQLFAAAQEKYGRALVLRPDLHGALYNWGNALADQARAEAGAAADELFARAAEKYGQALECKPDMHEAFVSWGNALLDQARSKKDEEQRDRLFAQAQQLYRDALRLRSDLREPITQWGLLLLDWAGAGQEDRRLLVQVEAEYERARAAMPGAGGPEAPLSQGRAPRSDGSAP